MMRLKIEHKAAISSMENLQLQLVAPQAVTGRSCTRGPSTSVPASRPSSSAYNDEILQPGAGEVDRLVGGIQRN